MTGNILLKKLLDSFQNSYDIDYTCDINGDIYDAHASFNATSSKYVLIKKAELWRADCFEQVFFRIKKETLTEEIIEAFYSQIKEFIEPQLVRHGKKWPEPDYMYTYITAIYICENGLSKEAEKKIRSFHYLKNYKFTIRGYSEARILVFDLKNSKIFGNKAAKAPVLMGHHFSSIAGAGPINGPIQAAVFGWVPVFLWVLIGGIFFGAVHDFGALFASVRNKGQSIGEVIASTMGSKAKKLFIIFSYLTLILVVAAFASIVANTFMATYTEAGAIDYTASAANATTAMISILFIIIAIAFGFLVYRRNAGLAVSTIIGIVAIIVCMIIGLNWHPIYLNNTTWMVIVGIYILAASVAPVWILLQPRDYLSSFLLYFMMLVAVVGIIGCGLTGGAQMDNSGLHRFSGYSGSYRRFSGIHVPGTFCNHRLRRYLRLPLTGWLRYNCKAAEQ